MNEYVEPIVSVLGGGLLGSGAVAAWTARKKVPAERDSIIVASAEMTVQGALAVASAEAARADRSDAENLVLRQRLNAALARVDGLQAALDLVRDELRSIQSIADH